MTNLVLFFPLNLCSISIDRRDLPRKAEVLPVLQIASLGHALLAFVNGEYVGKMKTKPDISFLKVYSIQLIIMGSSQAFNMETTLRRVLYSKNQLV